MGTTAQGPIHLLELCDQKLLEFVCNVDNKDMVWLEEIEEEAERMFTRCEAGGTRGGGKRGARWQDAPGAAWLLRSSGTSPPERQDRLPGSLLSAPVARARERGWPVLRKVGPPGNLAPLLCLYEEAPSAWL